MSFFCILAAAKAASKAAESAELADKHQMRWYHVPLLIVVIFVGQLLVDHLYRNNRR